MAQMYTPVITIDGPGGSGKGTVGLRLAQTLGWHFLDSGVLYRVLALAVMRGTVVMQEDSLARYALRINVRFEQEIWVDEEPVTVLLRTEDCGALASQIACFPAVRDALLSKQRNFCKPPGLVADGRDMGTVVFPEAQIKIFLEADPVERARRRYLQLKDIGQNVNLENLVQEILARDVRDKERLIAPLRPAKEAVVIDTTGMGIEQVLDRVLHEVHIRAIGV